MLRGATESTVTDAIETGNPFPGTYGFAGRLADGRIVRDVLGREPLFIDETGADWAFDPNRLATARPFPPGSVMDAGDISRVWSLPERRPVDAETAIARLREALDGAIDAPSLLSELAAGTNPETELSGESGTPQTTDISSMAIGFSGGVDSAYLAARIDAPLYAVGFPESHDLDAARDAADTLGRQLHTVTLDHDSLESLIPRVATAIGRTNAMDVQIALPLLAIADRVADDGFDGLVLGQGADELFGGYAKVEMAPDDPRVAADTVTGARDEVLGEFPAQVERDTLAVRSAGVEPVTPYLHDSVVEAALSLPSGLLVSRDRRKVALRQIAAETLPQDLAGKPKKAMQYGTLVSREMDRLARQAGFKRRMDDHVTQYIESRCSE